MSEGVSAEAYVASLIVDAFDEPWEIHLGEHMTLEQFLLEQGVTSLPAALVTFGNIVGDDDTLDQAGHYRDYEETLMVYLMREGSMREAVVQLRDHVNGVGPKSRPNTNKFHDTTGTRRTIAFRAADGVSLSREGFRATEIQLIVQ